MPTDGTYRVIAINPTVSNHRNLTFFAFTTLKQFQSERVRLVVTWGTTQEVDAHLVVFDSTGSSKLCEAYWSNPTCATEDASLDKDIGVTKVYSFKERLLYSIIC